jgi:hypothetical protein
MIAKNRTIGGGCRFIFLTGQRTIDNLRASAQRRGMIHLRMFSSDFCGFLELGENP